MNTAKLPWRIEKEVRDSGVARWTVVDATGAQASFSEVLDSFRDDAAFVDAWSEALREWPTEAYCWECPPLDARSIDRPFECVLVESPALKRAVPDSATFAEHFRAARDVAVFPSLGKDATLIAPCPRDGLDYAHLARFQRSADAPQIRALWRQVGISARAEAARERIWLSTAGLGVAWLHVRLDTRPKYYRHAPYRAAA